MKTYSLAYGSGQIQMNLDERHLIARLEGNAVPPMPDIASGLRAALDMKMLHRILEEQGERV